MMHEFVVKLLSRGACAEGDLSAVDREIPPGDAAMLIVAQRPDDPQRRSDPASTPDTSVGELTTNLIKSCPTLPRDGRLPAIDREAA